jgi:hypothetical protein
MDLAAFYAACREDGHGGAVYEQSMMVALLLYAYAIGERSPRRNVEYDATCMMCCDQAPDHTAVARFASATTRAVADLFGQVSGSATPPRSERTSPRRLEHEAETRPRGPPSQSPSVRPRLAEDVPVATVGRDVLTAIGCDDDRVFELDESDLWIGDVRLDRDHHVGLERAVAVRWRMGRRTVRDEPRRLVCQEPHAVGVKGHPLGIRESGDARMRRLRDFTASPSSGHGVPRRLLDHLHLCEQVGVPCRWLAGDRHASDVRDVARQVGTRV